MYLTNFVDYLNLLEKHFLIIFLSDFSENFGIISKQVGRWLYHLWHVVRDRPFNLKGGGGLWFFVSFRNFSSDNTRVRIFFFLSRKTQIFVRNLTLGYMTKTLNQIIFFPPLKSEYFFQQHWESQYFFRKKTYPPPFKLNGRSLTHSLEGGRWFYPGTLGTNNAAS